MKKVTISELVARQMKPKLPNLYWYESTGKITKSKKTEPVTITIKKGVNY